MPNIHIYGTKERVCLRDEEEVRKVLFNLTQLNNNTGDFIRTEGAVSEGHTWLLGYDEPMKKLVCLLRATRITGGNWWVVWDKERCKLDHFKFQTEVK